MRPPGPSAGSTTVGGAGGRFAAEDDRIRTAYARREAGGRDRSSWFEAGHVFMMQERERRVLALLRRELARPLEDVRILDIGCGGGHWLRRFVEWGARPEHLFGIDLLPRRIEEARRRCPPGVWLRCASATSADLRAEDFDLVLQSTVFTSVLDAEARREIAARMVRATRPGGWILWYDFRVDNPRNPDVRGIRAREVRSLFPECAVELRCITLAPPLVRRLAPVSWTACHGLSRLPFLCTHYLGVIRPPAAVGR